MGRAKDVSLVFITKKWQDLKWNQSIPAVASDNDSMGGADRIDEHLISDPGTKKQGKTYYYKIFMFFLSKKWTVCYLFKIKEGFSKSHLQLRLDLKNKIIKNIVSEMPPRVSIK